MIVASYGTLQTDNYTHILIFITPQSLLWQQCTLWPEMSSTLLSAFQRKQQPLELFLLQLQIQKHGGSSGWQNLQSRRSTPSKIPAQPTPPATWQHLLTKYVQEKSPQAEIQVDLEMWKLSYVQMVRQLPY